jgi:Fe-S cluster assembly protein SufD
MIAEKSNTAQQIIERLSGGGKVGHISNDLLSKSLMKLETDGIPSSKNEEYKYCNMEGILKKEFRNIEQRFTDVASVSGRKLQDTVTLVIVNGQYSAKLSDKLILKGLHISSFNDMPAVTTDKIGSLANPSADSFVALNTAFSRGGFYMRIEKDAVIPMPIHIIYISSSSSEAMVNTRNLVEVEENAEVTLIEEQVMAGSGKIFTNYLSEKIVGRGARLTTCLCQDEGENGFSVNTTQVSVGGNANYENITVTLGGQVVRNNHNVVLAGQSSEAHLDGLFASSGSQLVDNHTLMDHQVPHCESNELYKGIVNGKSTGVFNGKIYVRRDAQKTNAYQSSKNILLSDDATINTKPQLEIYANDVKCSHGTSTGKIDEEALFYLNARGIGRESARKMLLSSFAQEVINKITADDLRERITAQFENKI